MKINIRSKIEITDSIKNALERRVHFALGRFGEKIREVTLRIVDMNGPKGGVDKRCKVHISFAEGDRLTMEEDHEDLYVAIDQIFDRAGRSIARKLDRLKRTKKFSSFYIQQTSWKA